MGAPGSALGGLLERLAGPLRHPPEPILGARGAHDPDPGRQRRVVLARGCRVERSCGDTRPVLGHGEVPTHEPRVGRARREWSRGGDLVVVESAQGARERALRRAVGGRVQPLRAAGPQQLAGEVGVPGRDCVLRRTLEVAANAVLLCGASVQLSRATSRARLELRAQRRSHHRMAAVLAVLAVGGNQHELAARRLCEHRVRVPAPEHRVAERRGEALEHRGLGEEGAQRGGAAGEDLLAHVLRQRVIATVETRCGECRTLLRGDRGGGERERGRPALGAAHELLDRAVAGARSARAKQRRGLAGAHREIARPQLDERLRGAQPGERECRRAAGGEREDRAGGHADRERLHHSQRLVAAQYVNVVEHQHRRRAIVRRRAQQRPGGAQQLL